MTAGWLRRWLRRPPTIGDCMRAARDAPCEPLRARAVLFRDQPMRAPDPRMRAVNGPLLVARSLANRAEHYGRLGADPSETWGGPNLEREGDDE